MREVGKKFRVSYSSSNTFQGCQRKFWHQKVNKTPNDPDFEDDSTALIIGKAFHLALELSNHERKKMTPQIFFKACKEEGVVDQQQRGLILGMTQKYFDLHEKSGLKAVALEMRIGDDDVIGYIDLVASDDNGNWWIIDLKTAGRLSDSLLSRLAYDPQLNLYAYYAPMVADAHKLDLAKFMGVRYRVTTKTTIAMKKGEDVSMYAGRVKTKVESYDIAIEKKHLIPASMHKRFMRIKKEMDALRSIPEQEVPQNFSFCENYFKPCQYWSRCYGNTFTGCSRQQKVHSSKDMPLVSNGADEGALDDDLGAL